MPLVEFAYNNNFRASIGMAPYEALYGRKCQSPLCWYETGEVIVLGPNLVAETTEKIKKIPERILTAQSRQKSYADQRRKTLEFHVGEHILRRFRLVAYQVALPPHLSNLHDVFHVSQLCKYTSDVAHVLEPESVELKENLTFQVTPVRIDDTSVKKLRGKEVSLVKVAWKRAGVEEHTWELESEMRKDYPKLFSVLRFAYRQRLHEALAEPITPFKLCGSTCDLIGYSDSDFADCKLDRKSTSGTCHLLGNSLVSWHSKKQVSVALSTAEAEYVAAGSCCA
ncbi:uncharacterized protein LOC107615612 [Arachis ipaensis]|uniref:uncharacterized protein LOC107615612 n=1 Tax=Arachis ipaensis TaxID=130454 RepID=UPI0007AF22AA|nr:uncharacterized protein LOC107615612 [Arachis ipaensis]